MAHDLYIKSIARKGKLGIVFLSNDDEFPLLFSLIEEHQLRIGNRIDPPELAKIKTESDYRRADYYLSFILGSRSYSVGQVNQKLTQKGFDKNTRKRIIREYVEKGYLDDTRFARNLINSLMTHKPAGRAYLLAHLRSKYIADHIASEIVDQALENTDEVAMALILLESRRRYLAKFDLETARRKAYNYLSRRSIGYNAARKAFEQFNLEE